MTGRFEPGRLQPVPVMSQPPVPRQRPRRGTGVLGVAVVLLFLAGGVSAVVVARRRHGPSYPKAWDPRVAPLAAEVAKLRHLEFVHPVYVEFLTPAQYTKKTTSSGGGLSSDDLPDAANAVEEGRALGLVRGSPDLLGAANELRDVGTAAFYSYRDKRIYARGTTMTPLLKVTLAHALTHVVQDQRFDLLATYRRMDAMPGSDDLGLTALVEGDAATVQQEYVDTLSAADKKTYQSQLHAEAVSATKKLARLPLVSRGLVDERRPLGPTFVAMLKARGGEKAVDEAFRKPPTTFLGIWNPVLYLQHVNPAPVPVVELPKGATMLDHVPIGVFTGFLMLAERLPPLQALDAADTWRSDDALTYRTKGGRACLDIRIRGKDDTATDAIATAFAAWAKAMPARAGARVTQAANHDVLVHTCDPGPKAHPRLTSQGDTGVRYVEARASVAQRILTSADARSTLNAATIFCIANDAVHDVPLSVVSADKRPSSAEQRRLDADNQACVEANRGDD